MAQSDPYDEITAVKLQTLRDAALAHLSGDTAPYESGVALKAFEALELSKEGSATPLALEAFAAGVIAHKRRPRRAQKAIYRLYQIRIARGEEAAHQEFTDQLTASVEHGFSLEGIYLTKSLSEIDHDALWKDTGKAIASVEDVFGPAFLNSGTLLGAVREGRFIDHDDDVDIAVVMSAASPEDAAKQWLAGIKVLTDRGLVKGSKGRTRRNPCVFKLESATGVNIDVFPAWFEGDSLYVYPHTSGELSREQLLPLKACAATGLPVPRDAEAMLAVNYGSGWRVPDPAYQFPWQAANERFKAFRTALEEETEK